MLSFDKFLFKEAFSSVRTAEVNLEINVLVSLFLTLLLDLGQNILRSYCAIKYNLSYRGLGCWAGEFLACGTQDRLVEPCLSMLFYPGVLDY